MYNRCCFLWGLSLTLSLAPVVPVQAQLIPDSTLGEENSIVTPIDSFQSQIDGGAIRGSNLFHSFREFNIDRGKSVYFANPGAISPKGMREPVANILTRVTGENPSSILGKLGVLGNANLFLINPNGIIFGQDASLDVSGSFTASTAPSIWFDNGFEFSATNPQAPALLTINLVPGLQYASDPVGNINHGGNLTVNPGEEISLFGNNVTITGSLNAPQGIVSVLGDRISLEKDTRIDVSSDIGGGTVIIGGEFHGQNNIPTAKRTFIGSNVSINADAINWGDGGNIIVWADEVTGFYGNITAHGGSLGGNGGLVKVSGKQHLIFRGNVDTFASNGHTGTLLLAPMDITITNGSGEDNDDTIFRGNNSSVSVSILSTPLSTINDTAPTTIYESELERLSGNTNLFLQATNNIQIADLVDNELKLVAGSGEISFITDADGNGIGSFVMEDNIFDTIHTNRRNIAISGANLVLGNINTSNESLLVNPAPNSGSINLKASNGNISSGNLDASSSLSRAGAISLEATQDIYFTGTSANTSGNTGGGDISITTDSLTLTNAAQLITTTNGTGNAGTVNINASNSVLFDGQTINGANSGAFSIVAPGAVGDAGGIFITTGSLEVSNGAILSSMTNGKGDAGSININATDSILFDGKATNGFSSGVFSLVRSDATGNAGGISITTNSLEGRNGARLSASTFGEGNAGSITIKARDSIFFNGEAKDGSSGGAFSLVNSGGVGNAGGVSISARTLEITDGNQLSASTFGKGNAGSVNVNAQESIKVHLESQNFSRSGILSVVAPGAIGDAGGISLATGSLEVNRGGIISASTRGEGNAGSVIINATDSIWFDGKGSGLGLSNSGAFSLVTSTANGNAGGLFISTKTLDITNGGIISASTFAEGNAGSVIINAADYIRFDGQDKDGFSSGAFSLSRTLGNGGNVSINTKKLEVINKAQVSTSSSGAGNAGNLMINATDSIALKNGSSLASEATANGNAGFLPSVLQNLLLVMRHK